MKKAGFIIKQYMKMAVQNGILPLVYHTEKKKKIRKKTVIFADAHHDKMPYSMEPLYELVQKNNWQTELHIIDFSKSSFGSIIKYMIRFMKSYGTAEYVVLCDNHLPTASCKKRKETKVLQLWHGGGMLKKFGYDTKTDIPSYYKGNVLRNCDMITVSAKCCIDAFSSAMKLSKDRFYPVGIARTDRFFHEIYKKTCIEKFNQNVPEAKGKKIIVWAPTFRGNAGMPNLPIVEEMKKLPSALGDEFYVVCKLHPHMEEKRDDFRKIAMTTEELLPVADLLITDYSSILFDYCLLEKPAVFYVPDLEEYEKERGFYMDFASMPGAIVKEYEKLSQAVKDEIKHFDKKRMIDFKQKYMTACDGHATEKIFQLMKEKSVKEEVE